MMAAATKAKKRFNCYFDLEDRLYDFFRQHGGAQHQFFLDRQKHHSEPLFVDEVARLNNPSFDEFKAKCLLPGVPVVLVNTVRARTSELWSLETFRTLETRGHIVRDLLYEKDIHGHTIGDFLHHIQDVQAELDDGRLWCLANVEVDSLRPDLGRDVELPKYLEVHNPGNLFSYLQMRHPLSSLLYVGGKFAHTGLHLEACSTWVWRYNAWGGDMLYMIWPAEKTPVLRDHPLLGDILLRNPSTYVPLDVFHDAGIFPKICLVKPGEAIVIPGGCAHQTLNMGTSVSVSGDFMPLESLEQAYTTLQMDRMARRSSVSLLPVKKMAWNFACDQLRVANNVFGLSGSLPALMSDSSCSNSAPHSTPTMSGPPETDWAEGEEQVLVVEEAEGDLESDSLAAKGGNVLAVNLDGDTLQLHNRIERAEKSQSSVALAALSGVCQGVGNSDVEREIAMALLLWSPHESESKTAAGTALAETRSCHVPSQDEPGLNSPTPFHAKLDEKISDETRIGSACGTPCTGVSSDMNRAIVGSDMSVGFSCRASILADQRKDLLHNLRCASKVLRQITQEEGCVKPALVPNWESARDTLHDNSKLAGLDRWQWNGRAPMGQKKQCSICEIEIFNIFIQCWDCEIEKSDSTPRSSLSSVDSDSARNSVLRRAFGPTNPEPIITSNEHENGLLSEAKSSFRPSFDICKQCFDSQAFLDEPEKLPSMHDQSTHRFVYQARIPLEKIRAAVENFGICITALEQGLIHLPSISRPFDCDPWSSVGWDSCQRDISEQLRSMPPPPPAPRRASVDQNSSHSPPPSRLLPRSQIAAPTSNACVPATVELFGRAYTVRELKRFSGSELCKILVKLNYKDMTASRPNKNSLIAKIFRLMNQPVPEEAVTDKRYLKRPRSGSDEDLDLLLMSDPNLPVPLTKKSRSSREDKSDHPSRSSASTPSRRHSQSSYSELEDISNVGEFVSWRNEQQAHPSFHSPSTGDIVHTPSRSSVDENSEACRQLQSSVHEVPLSGSSVQGHVIDQKPQRSAGDVTLPYRKEHSSVVSHHEPLISRAILPSRDGVRRSKVPAPLQVTHTPSLPPTSMPSPFSSVVQRSPLYISSPQQFPLDSYAASLPPIPVQHQTSRQTRPVPSFRPQQQQQISPNHINSSYGTHHSPSNSNKVLNASQAINLPSAELTVIGTSVKLLAV